MSGCLYADNKNAADGPLRATTIDPPIVVSSGWSAFDWFGSGRPFDQEGAFTFSRSGTTILTVTDSFCPGDQFRVYDFGAPIGDTSPVAISSTCTPFAADVALANPKFSHGTFVLGPGNHSITIQTITNPFPPGTGYLRVDPFSGSVDLVDPVSDLLYTSAFTIISDPRQPIFSSPNLVTRTGVAADGVVKLVIRFNAPSAGNAAFSLVDENGQTVFGQEENGALTDLQGSPIDAFRSIPTVPNAGNKAFAVYTAPNRFVRMSSPSDTNLSERKVFLKVTFSSVSGAFTTLPLTPILIVRPLVMLVHGLWSDSTAWSSFPLLTVISSTGTPPPGPAGCVDTSRFITCVIDYSQNPGSASKFAAIAPIVGKTIRDKLSAFRQYKRVAAIQADVIAHSMGGNVIRTMPLCGTIFKDCEATYTYKQNLNMGNGDIHRLITIGTPHLGSNLANLLATNRSTKCGPLGWGGTVERQFALKSKPLGGAIDDLQANAGAIDGLNRVTSPFPIHFVVGVASTNDETLFNQGLINDINACFSISSIREALGNSDSDLVVPVASQRKNLSDGAPGTTSSSLYGNTIHASSLNTKNVPGFSPDELHFTLLELTIINLLDTGQFITP